MTKGGPYCISSMCYTYSFTKFCYETQVLEAHQSTCIQNPSLPRAGSVGSSSNGDYWIGHYLPHQTLQHGWTNCSLLNGTHALQVSSRASVLGLVQRQQLIIPSKRSGRSGADVQRKGERSGPQRVWCWFAVCMSFIGGLFWDLLHYVWGSYMSLLLHSTHSLMYDGCDASVGDCAAAAVSSRCAPIAASFLWGVGCLQEVATTVSPCFWIWLCSDDIDGVWCETPHVSIVPCIPLMWS